MIILFRSVVASLAILFSACTNALALPGYHITDNKSAIRAVREYAQDSAKFEAVIYQAELDKNLWRLAIEAHKYHLLKPDDIQRQISFTSAYWRAQEPGVQEKPPKAAIDHLRSLRQEAVRLTEESVKKAPDSVMAQLNYGKYLVTFVMGVEKVPAMLKAFRTAVHIRPDMGMTHYWLGAGFLSTGDYSAKNAERAIVELKKALSLDPRLTSSYFMLTLSYCLKKDYKSAKDSLDKYIKFKPDQAGRSGIIHLQRSINEELKQNK